MGFLLTIAVILFVLWIIGGVIGATGPGGDPDVPPVPPPQRGAQPRHNVRREGGPDFTSTPTARPRMTFQDGGRSDRTRAAVDTDGLVDALTGRRLRRGAELYQCRRCKVFYESHSHDLIRRESGGRCVSCGSADIVRSTEPSRPGSESTFVNVVTLRNYRDYVGQVVTFEGVVRRVHSGRQGTNHTLVFEDTTRGADLKIVVLDPHLAAVGGAGYLESLVGRTVRVRGRLAQDPRFGYHITVNDRSMIVSVR